jgi:hypothetical protein
MQPIYHVNQLRPLAAKAGRRGSHASNVIAHGVACGDNRATGTRDALGG